MSEPEAQCALNPDGSLKDTKDIIFYNDPDDAIPVSTPSSAQPPTDAFSVLLQTGCKPVPLTAVRKKVALQLSTPLLDNEDSHAAGANMDIDTDHSAGQSDEAEDKNVPAPEDEPEDLQDTTI
ncbi:uncharacterized protein BJ212DRAFT_1479210 [Suillus subaureus]|uniref:Uncharacterized protein n=1 Tax=Suillus subaureus TaxID=48587 RepID=A0A9P7JFE1_9AGAM|nr:uncharacterized protein BJ212DRAFT_1479210 [Suillus subaureus]KAG1819094.1 hypothetical protein BJ212DRAFT_1479210 [Suillus subaureus]